VALIFIDSSDHYDGAITDKYTGGGAFLTTGRHGDVIQSTISGLRKAFPQAVGGTQTYGVIRSGTAICGAAVKFSDLTGSIFGFGYIGATSMLSLNVAADGRLKVTRGTGGTLLGYSDADVVQESVWQYIEWQATFSSPALTDIEDQVEIYITNIYVWRDGELVITVLDGGRFTALEPPLLYGWTNVTRYGVQDDFYVSDGSGVAPWNAPLGDVEIAPLWTNGAGFSTQWDPSPVVANYLNVDDVIPDEDTTYNYTAVVNDIDLFEMENVDGVVEEILGVQVVSRARRTEEGFAELANQIRHDGVTYDGHEARLQTEYTYSNIDIYQKAPDDTDWDVTKVNAIQAGYKRTL
jgi:hypothetical protein